MDRDELLGTWNGKFGLRGGKYFVTVDTVGNFSVVRSAPGTGMSAGKTAIGNADGYDSMDAARKFLEEVKNDDSQCKGVVAG